jgi:hypothetical protein
MARGRGVPPATSGTRTQAWRNPKRGPMKARIPLIAALLFVDFAGPLQVDAEGTSKIPRIGYLSGATPATAGPLVEAFKQGLRELGYVEGKTYVLEVRYTEGRSERFPELARELVGRKVDAVVGGNDAAIKREDSAVGSPASQLLPRRLPPCR